MHHYALLIAYDGTSFAGWQVQNNGEAIQRLLEKALSLICKVDHISVTGSGRTDAGVHAEGQVAHFKVPSKINETRTLRSLNALLPSDIRILKLAEVEPSFHARWKALGKIYRYRLDLSTFSDPFERKIRATVGPLPCIQEMKEASKYFLGRHNFKAFANDNEKGSAGKNPFRTIHSITFIEPSENKLDIEWYGEGFLYKMVRNLVGCLLAVGKGKINPEMIPILLEKGDRRLAPPAAVAKGLTLMKVFYEPDPFLSPIVIKALDDYRDNELDKGPAAGIEQKSSNMATCCF